MTRNRRDDEDDAPRRTSGFRYQKRDPEEAKKRTERNLSGVDSYLKDICKIYKAPEGDNSIRILPATWEGAKHYGVEIFIHYDVGDGAYLCNEKMRGKACPICEERAHAKQKGDDEFADKLRPSSRVLIYILDREKERDGVQVWSVGARMDNDIARLSMDKRSGEYLEIDHPDKGYDLAFVRDGQGMKTRYTGFQISRRSTPLDNPKALQFVTENPLPDQLIYYSYDHIKRVFSGGVSGKDEDDDTPARSKSRDVDDDDAPKKGSSKGKKPEVDLSWVEVHELSFRKLTNLVEEQELDIDVEASRDDEELADEVCGALGIIKPKKKRAVLDEEEDPPARKKATDDEDEKEKPARRKVVDEDEDEPPARKKLRSIRDDD